MSKILRYGVLGCGYFGAEFARAVKEQTDSELAMIYSPGESSKRLSAELACPIANTAEELINSPFVDAVIVATPNYMHKEHVLAAAKAKKHIFCEKPFALNKDDADEMVKACKANGVTLMVGHIMHFYSGIEALQKMIKSGEMGDIINAHVERTGWEHKKSEISWKKQQAKSGGHLFHHIHEIDIIQWIMGEADSVYAVGDNLGHKEEGFGDEADVLLLTMRFKNGSFATLQYGSGFRIGNHFIRINGTKKGAVINFKTAEITIKSDDGETIIPLFKDEKSAEDIKKLFARTDGGIAYGSPTERPPEYILVALRDELNTFRRTVECQIVPNGKEDLFDGSSAIHSVAIAQNALRSINEKCIVYF